MKFLFNLILGLFGLFLIIGGLGAVAEDTYPQAVPLASAAVNAGHTGAVAGDPTLLLICLAIVGGGIILIVKGR